MYKQLVTKIRQYIQVTKGDKQVIEALFSQRNLAKGDFFLREGKICRELGFINKGIVCYYVSPDGNEVVHNFAKENEFICNYDSLIRCTASQKNIVALEPLELLVISFDNLQKLFKTISGGERFGRLLMEDVYTSAINQILSFYTESSQQRYSNLVKTNHDLLQRIPQYYVASYVGVRPPSLSRIRKRIMKS
ncbi:MAG: Crp/Fnr family transcriptional regulator [Chitinophagaceae bacterium]